MSNTLPVVKRRLSATFATPVAPPQISSLLPGQITGEIAKFRMLAAGRSSKPVLGVLSTTPRT
eukprot:4673905-Pyramimonas_sp.AAC.1